MRATLACFSLLTACSHRPEAPHRSAQVAQPSLAVSSAPAASVAAPPAERISPALLALGRSVERARIERDVKRLARARAPGSPGWKQVQALLQQRLVELGFEIERHAYGTGVNVIGTLRGQSRERVIVSAHYDHIERCAGADDNASGLAAALELARVVSSGASVRSLVVAFWDEEERGLKGSLAYAKRSRAEGDPIVAAIAFDSIGFSRTAEHSQRVPVGFETLLPEQAALLAQRGYRGNFIALVANPSARGTAERITSFASALGLPWIGLEVSALQAAFVPDLFRSDHAAFWFADYPGLLLTDTAELRNPNYHCLGGNDGPATLDYEFLTQVTGSAAAAVAEALQPTP